MRLSPVFLSGRIGINGVLDSRLYIKYFDVLSDGFGVVLHIALKSGPL